jgi:hypothetical protein
VFRIGYKKVKGPYDPLTGQYLGPTYVLKNADEDIINKLNEASYVA